MMAGLERWAGRRIPLTEAEGVIGYKPHCDCGHPIERHAPAKVGVRDASGALDSGPCGALDSYGVLCSCPSFDCTDGLRTDLPDQLR